MITAKCLGFDVRLAFIRRGEFGKSICSYSVVTPTGVQFTCEEFSPSPMFPWDSVFSIVQLLGWATITPDFGSSNLERYNAEQLQWAESSECAELSSILWEEAIFSGSVEEGDIDALGYVPYTVSYGEDGWEDGEKSTLLIEIDYSYT